jgi:transcription-repair coupling factor (superfamily II helicase)
VWIGDAEKPGNDVSTMIIENGLDIPSVNTMIVNRADAFGLSQLYQLRGRVGRSTQKAYCFFMVPADKALTEPAMKRLRAIAEFDELGSGFALAMRDLEIRGSGNILGREQHGHLVTIGFELYCRMLDEAVRELKGLPAEARPEPRLSTDVDAFLPDEYVSEPDEKVAFYKRLADAREVKDIQFLQVELRDRFGRLKPSAQGLFDLRRVRVMGAMAGASAITIRKGRVDVELAVAPEPAELRRWMEHIHVPVEFQATGRFALKAEGGIPEALLILAGMAGVAPPEKEIDPIEDAMTPETVE